MEFQFAPWERLTRDVVDGDADTLVVVEGVEWLCRRCDRFQWARRADQPPLEWNYLLHPIPKRSGNANNEYPKATNLSKFLLSEDQAFSLGRIWQLDSTLFAVWSEARGWRLFRKMWHCLRDDLMNSVRFEFACDTHLPSSIIHAALLCELENPETDFSLSVRYIRLSEQQKAEIFPLVQTKSATLQEFKRCIQTALRAFAPQWPQWMSAIAVEFEAPEGRGTTFKLAGQPILGIRERTIVRRVIDHYMPHRTTDISSLPLQKRSFVEEGTSYFQVEVTKPSQQEQLEAALELRAWLQTHWPDGAKHLGKIV